MSTQPTPSRYEGDERRRRPRGALSRLLTAPLAPAPARRRSGPAPARGVLWGALAVAVMAAAGWIGWASRVPTLVPRDRPEALCFVLARERYAPPLVVEPGSTMVRGRFSPQTPAGIAVRQAMGFTDDMVLREDARPVGDYQVSVLWLRLPGDPGHWMVLAWMEDADLAVASFHFQGDEPELSHDERVWGERLLVLALTPENFRAGALPAVRVRGAAPLRFGPKGS